MHTFYSTSLRLKNEHELLELNDEESKHCSKVLRLKSGNNVKLIDGLGNFAIAQLIDGTSKKCITKLIKLHKNIKKHNFYTHIAIAPTKNINRFEWFLEKATEIGVDEITPLLCFNSERKIIKTERLQKILIAAIKQSQQYHLPKLNNLIHYSDFISKSFDGKKMIAHCYEKNKRLLKNEISQNNLILIGPEGDFSEIEIKKAIANNYIPITLGNTRLRTETAGIAACHTIAVIIG